MGLLQILLCIVIARSSYLSYSRSISVAAKYRMMIFGIAFVVYALKITLRLHHPETTPLEPSLIMFLQHSLGVIFFILLGTIGLLYFVKTGLRERVKIASYLLVGIILLFDLLYIAYAAANPLVLKYSLDLSKVLHIIQILVLVFVTAVILRRITKVGQPRVLTLPLKYPFGFGVVLLMLADLGHILNLTILKGVMELILIEYALTTFSLGIITWKVHEISKVPPLIREQEELSKDEVAIIDNILRQVYYGLSYIDVGERDLVFANFLEKTRLKAVFDRENVGIKGEKVHELISENPDFLFDVAMGMLSYFKENPQSIGELQTHYLTEYLRMLHSLTEVKNKRACPVCNSESCYLYSHYNRRERVGHARYAELWRRLSEAYGDEAHKYLHHLEKLQDWGVIATNAFFETRHSTGSRDLDERVGKIPSRGLVLYIRDARIDKKRIFKPMILKNLGEWRNIVYVSSDPIEKMLMDYGTLEDCVSEGRLTLVSLSSKVEEIENPYPGCYRVNESTSGLLEYIIYILQKSPLSSIIFAVDLNPLVIRESPKDVHGFFTDMMETFFQKNVTIFASISGNMNPVSMDILEDKADVIIRFSLTNGEVVTTVSKPSLKDRKITLRKELYELLRFVNDENNQGREPNYNDVKTEFEITSVTARKWINELIRKGMLESRKVGRSKTLRVTDKGREVAVYQSL
jgi:predicted transcriptional regulator